MTSFGLQVVVVVWTIVDCADALEVEAVAGLSLAKARVVDGPFVLGRRADECVDSLAVFVQRDERRDCG